MIDWKRIELEKPKKNGYYLVWDGSYEVVRWKNDYFDMNPQDVPYYHSKQPQFWAELTPPPWIQSIKL